MTLSTKAAGAAIAAALLFATPLLAQPKDDPAPFGELMDGVRGFFNRLFSGGDQKAPAQPESPPAPVPQSAPASPPPAQDAGGAAVSRTLHEAVVRGDYDATVKLLDQAADIEARDPGSGASPLHYAVMKGRMRIVDLLLSRGADVNSRTRNGTTPLHTAALYAHKEIAERLLEQRADINAVSAGGSTPLALATAARNKPLAEMLRERGAK